MVFEQLYFQVRCDECIKRHMLASVCRLLIMHASVQLLFTAQELVAKFGEMLNKQRRENGRITKAADDSQD